ncbi:MAG: cytochrome b5 domain-containing protein [Clostridium sp.]
MSHSMQYNYDNNFYRINPTHKTYKTVEGALRLVKEAIQEEREDELFYNFLLCVAPTEEEKNIIITIRDDERKHNKYLREIYEFYTEQCISATLNTSFTKPRSYINGIKKAKLGELGAVEKYSHIRVGIPDKYYRDMVLEILMDELKHVHKYDYILYLRLEKLKKSQGSWKPEFITDEPMKIDRTFGVDFSRETTEFTLRELAYYDGTMGKPSYVAVNGIIYDVSQSPAWSKGSHYGLTPGKDFSSLFNNWHGLTPSMLEKLPKVGILI